MSKIGVFDSGIGGLKVAKSIEAAFPHSEVIFVHDKEHVPYGTKSPEEVHRYVVPILQQLETDGCEAIVIACNTVTTTLIERLRQVITIPLVGMEPMVKPAVELSKTNIVSICATPATLQSNRYEWLKQKYAPGTTVVEPDCSDWAYMIENNQINESSIRERIEQVLAQGADVIVLGCTHYHWIEEEIRSISSGRAKVIQPEEPVIAQLKRVLKLPV